MHRAKPLVFFFLLVFALIYLVPARSNLINPGFYTEPRVKLNWTSAKAASPTIRQGTITYRVRGPLASPYGLGTALIGGGAGIPIAMVRVQNMLQKAIKVISQLPQVKDSYSLESVSQWAHEGIPIDIAMLLPIMGYYEATINFTLKESSKGIFELQSGRVIWKTSNYFNFSGGDMVIRDSFSGSGSQELDPKRDRVSLQIDQKSKSPNYMLDMKIHHPEPVSGSSEINAGGGIAVMTLDVKDGDMIIDGSSMGIPISALGFPSDNILEGPGLDQEIGYIRQGPLDEMEYSIETWRDLLDNQVLVECDFRDRTLKADAGGPYNFKIGDEVVLDSSQSQGDIVSWDWTFEPGPGSSGGTLFNSSARKEGEKVNAIFLNDTKATLTVKDADGHTDTDMVMISKTDRPWKTKYEGPNNREEADSQEKTLPPGSDTSILATPSSNGTWDVWYTSGESVNFDGSDGTLIPSGDGKPRSWEGDGYRILKVNDANGPFDGMYYVDSYDIKIHRRTLINPYVLPASQGGKPALAGLPLFYDENKRKGYDVDGYLEGIREHEFEHSMLMRYAIARHDPAPMVEEMYGSDRDVLIEKVDKTIDKARLEVCSASRDPLPKGVTWSDQLIFPAVDGSGWVTGNGTAGYYPPQSKADKEKQCE